MAQPQAAVVKIISVLRNEQNGYRSRPANSHPAPGAAEGAARVTFDTYVNLPGIEPDARRYIRPVGALLRERRLPLCGPRDCGRREREDRGRDQGQTEASMRGITAVACHSALRCCAPRDVSGEQGSPSQVPRGIAAAGEAEPISSKDETCGRRARRQRRDCAGVPAVYENISDCYTSYVE